MMAQALAPNGALFTFIALWTGALWGKPTWGTYCAWDARLTSELILLFLYLGFMSLQASIEDPRRADARSFYGMFLAHLGIAVFVVGVTLVRATRAKRTYLNTLLRDIEAPAVSERAEPATLAAKGETEH